MATRVAIPYREVRLKVVGPSDDFIAPRIQSLDIPATLPNTTIDELGNSGHAGIITDIPEVSITFQAFDVSHKLFAYLTGTDPTAYPGGGVDVNNLDYIDAIVEVKSDTTTDIVKAIHARKLKITDFTFTYSVDGESTEEYTAEGSEKRYLKYDVVIDEGTDPIAAGSGFTLSNTPLTLNNGDELLSCIGDGVWLEEGPDYSVAGTTVTVSAAVNTKILCLYHYDNSATWADVSDTVYPAAIRGKNIPITIAANSIPRVQSVTIRGTFPTTRVEEMGNIEVVGYVTDPPEVTGDLTVLDTDFNLVSLLTTGTWGGGAEDEFGVAEYEDQSLALDIIIKNPADNATVLKTVYIPEMRITSDGYSTSVGGQATYTFGFSSNTAECVVYSGAR
jgi:hypothetical protein